MSLGIFDLDGKPAAVPLKSVRICGDIRGLYGQLAVEQLYVNEGKGDLEIIYTFPLPDRAIISHFEARVGERTITGEIREKEEAFRAYDRALRKGDSAFLLEQFRPNIFQVSLGRVLPGEEVIIKVVYLEALLYRDGELRISIPTLVAPRYIPGSKIGEKRGMGWAGPTGQVADADFITPPVDSGAAYGVQLNLNIEPLMPIDGYSSPSHPLDVEMNEEGSAGITLAGGEVPLDRDIIILGRCRHESAAAGLAWTDPENGEGYLYLNFLPRLDCDYERERINYIFLIDISGSMSGTKLEQAKNALQLCLRNMEAGDSFNIVAFESGCHCLSPAGALPFNQASLERAANWIDNLHAMGGTEILQPVEFALENSGGKGSVILLFTDGQVGNEQEIIDLVRRGIGGNRLFAFGIDTAVNSYFINKLAEAGKGLPEFIYPGERIEDKVIRQFSRINTAAAVDVEIEWSAMQDVECYPRAVPALFDGDPVALAARYEGALAGTVSLTGRLKGKAFRSELDLSRLGAGEAGFLKKIWARMKIEHLEGVLGEINPRRRAAVAEEIVNVSRDYSLASSQTSFVAVQERVNRATGVPETVVVPVAPAAEWRMLTPRLLEPSYGPIVLSDSLPQGSGFLELKTVMTPQQAGTAYSRGDRTAPEPGADLQEAIRSIALQQLAEGSFPAETGAADRRGSLFENTALAMLAMLLAAEEIGIYRRQIEKAISYLVDQGIQNRLGEYHFFIAALACKLYLEKIGPGRPAAKLAASGAELMQSKAGPLSAVLQSPEITEKHMLRVLLDLLEERKKGSPEVSAKGGIRESAAAVFSEMLQPLR